MKGLNEVRGQNDGNDSRKDVEKDGMKKVKRRRRRRRRLGNKTFKGNCHGIDERHYVGWERMLRHYVS